MLGMHRLRDGRVTFYEIITIQTDGASLVMLVGHCNADLAGWEGNATRRCGSAWSA
jgi:hypothetical protein